MKDSENLKQNSVFQLYAYFRQYNAMSPWRQPKLCLKEGRVFVVQYDQQVYLLTAASLIEGASSLKIISSGDQYSAKMILMDRICGLALLAVEAGSFWEKARPLKLTEHDETGSFYWISREMIEHFLEDYSKNDQYLGFPEFKCKYQLLNDVRLRNYLGLGSNQTGVRIKWVSLSDSVSGLFKIDDILMSLDGVPIHDDGTVDLSGKRLHFSYLIKRKQIGDLIQAVVLREGDICLLSLKLGLAREIKTPLPIQYHMPPLYYIHAGLVFMSLSEGEVFISRILPTKLNRSLMQYRGEMIQKVNSVFIRDLKDLIYAIESYKGSDHLLKTKNGNLIILNNASSTENASILDQFDIPSDRSQSLLEWEPMPEFKLPAPRWLM